MGNADTKLNFRKAVVQLTSKNRPIESSDDSFWDQFWSENVTNVQDVFALVPGAEIRALRIESPTNLATFCYKAVEKLVKTVDSSCRTQQEQQTALNCARLLTRVLPYLLEDPEWHGFFWSSLPASENESIPLGQSLLNAVCDLLFCPDFTVTSTKRSGPERAEELSSLDSCEYIWAAGVGFARNPPRVSTQDAARCELLRLLLTCCSETIYMPPAVAAVTHNKWTAYLTSSENRHALPLFTSLLNTVCSYDPVGLGLPYNHLLFSDTLEPLVETALQLLIVTLDHDTSNHQDEDVLPDNLFINYLSRIHRDEDLQLVLRGVARLLNNPLQQTYLPNSCKKVHLHQELLVLFWKMCDYNKKFMYYVLKSSDVLEILVPILYHLNDSRADQSRVGLMHIAVFILLLLSGERNFGVRLNKPYTATVPMDIPVFTGTHADLLIVVAHKLVTTGHVRLQPLFDCLLTILVNVSPYLKTLSMVASSKLLHLLEAFSTPWFLFSRPNNHQLVFFLLEMFNNIIQYQFDGNSNLVYTIIRKRSVFHSLANLPHEAGGLARVLAASGAPAQMPPDVGTPLAGPEPSMDGARPALPAPPGTLDPSLPATPAITTMTERESVHPSTPADSNYLEQPRSGGDGQDHTSKSPSPDTSSRKNSTTESEHLQKDANPKPEGVDPSWRANAEWVSKWRNKLPLQTIMRLLQVLVPQVEKICIDKVGSRLNGVLSGRESNSQWAHPNLIPTDGIQKLLLTSGQLVEMHIFLQQPSENDFARGLTDESEILRFLQHGTLVGLLPVPHPILIRKYQANAGTAAWFRTYTWGVIYIRNVDPPIWYDTDVKLFEIQRV